MDPRTGRVLAMVGGFSYAESEFNRATQAMRQPGSSFKPIVYSAALDNGYTPASVVLDAPIEIVNGDGSVWRPENYAQQFYGPQTLRRGIERSRNVMTVRLAKDLGMPLISDYAKMFGIYDDPVSYTHLDVYKRQWPRRATLPGFDEPGLAAASNASSAAALPVSAASAPSKS